MNDGANQLVGPDTEPIPSASGICSKASRQSPTLWSESTVPAGVRRAQLPTRILFKLGNSHKHHRAGDETLTYLHRARTAEQLTDLLGAQHSANTISLPYDPPLSAVPV